MVSRWWRNIQVGTPTAGYDWSTDRLKSDWLKSTSDPRGRCSLPGNSQKYTHPRRFTLSHSMIHSWILNIQKFCTQLYICELCFAFVKRILWMYIFFMHVNWFLWVYIIFFFFVHVNWVSCMWIWLRMCASCLLRELLLRPIRFHSFGM